MDVAVRGCKRVNQFAKSAIKLHLFAISLFLTVFAPQIAFAQISYGKDVGQHGDGVGLSIGIAPGDLPAASYFNEFDKVLRYGTLNGTTWQSENVDSTLSSTSNTALVFLSGNPNIIYFNAALNRLKHAFKSNGVWTSQTINASGNSGSGLHAVACGTGICVSYYDSVNRDLKFARYSGGTWQALSIDASAGDIGSENSIAVTPSGLAVIAYFDATNRALKVAQEQSDGSWTSELLNASGEPIGRSPSIAIAPNGSVFVASALVKGANPPQDLGVFLARKTPGGSWTTARPLSQYSGGTVQLSILPNGLVGLSTRFVRVNPTLGNYSSSLFAALDVSGVWMLEYNAGELGPVGINYAYERVASAFALSGEKAIAYRIVRNTTGGQPPLNAIRIHQPQAWAERTGPLPTPTPTPSPEATPSPGPSPSPTPAPTSSQSPFPTATPTPGATPSPTASATPIPSASPVPTASATPIPSATPAPSSTPIPSPSAAPTPDPRVNPTPDPFLTDTDLDGISDGQELLDGTNPNDRGSFRPQPGVESCVAWTHYQNEKSYIVEARNLTSVARVAVANLLNSRGGRMGSLNCTIGANAQCSLDFSQTVLKSRNKSGTICFSHNGAPGEVQGQLAITRPTTRTKLGSTNVTLSSYGTTILLFSGARGEQTVALAGAGTTAQGAAPKGKLNQLLFITQSEPDAASGTVHVRDSAGVITRSLRVQLAGRGRGELTSTQLGVTGGGSATWIPDDLNRNFIFGAQRNSTFRSKKVDAHSSSTTVLGAPGSGERLVAPFDTRANSVVLELVNTSDSVNSVSITLFDVTGLITAEEQFELPPRSLRSVALSKLLPAPAVGQIAVDGSVASGLNGYLSSVFMKPDGRRENSHIIQLQESVGNELFAQFDSSGRLNSKLLLTNTTGEAVNFSLTLSKESQVITEKKRSRSNLSAVYPLAIVALSPHQTVEFDLATFGAKGSAGFLSILSERAGAISGYIARKNGALTVVDPLR